MICLICQRNVPKKKQTEAAIKRNMGLYSNECSKIAFEKWGYPIRFEEVGDNKSDWNDLIDPTQYLIDAEYAPTTLLK